MASRIFKCFLRKTASYKSFSHKEYDITKNKRCDGCQSRLASIIFNFFHKPSATQKGTEISSDAVSGNQEVAKELHKFIIRILKYPNINYISPLETTFVVLI